MAEIIIGEPKSGLFENINSQIDGISINNGNSISNGNSIDNGQFVFSFAKPSPSKVDDSEDYEPIIKPNNEETTRIAKKTQYHKGPRRRHYTCDECDVEMSYSMIDDSPCYICDQCGSIQEIIGDNSEIKDGGSIHTSCAVINNYNTSSTSSAPLRMIGPESRSYQKRLISSTSDYRHTQRKNTLDDMLNAAHKYEGAGIPKHIIDKAADEYNQMQQQYIKRGDVRRGIMAWLVYELCIDNGIHRNPKEVAEMFDTSHTELSNGSKIVADARAEGVIGKQRQMSGFNPDKEMNAILNRNFEVFKIPGGDNGFGDVMTFASTDNEDNQQYANRNYREFATQLIRYTIRRRISSSSVPKSRCAGVLYILAQKCPELNLDRELISQNCNISKSTVVRFANPILKLLKCGDCKESDPKMYRRFRELKHIFNKYDIPWKD